MIRLPAVAALFAVTALAGCGPNGGGTAVAISTGNGSDAGGAGGKVRIDTPAFKGQFALPGTALSAASFDIDGARLYPGSRIAELDVASAASAEGGEVTVRFDSPAPVAAVRGWLEREFARTGAQVSVQGDRLQGRTKDRRFTIDLTAKGAQTEGMVTIG